MPVQALSPRSAVSALQRLPSEFQAAATRAATEARGGAVARTPVDTVTLSGARAPDRDGPPWPPLGAGPRADGGPPWPPLVAAGPGGGASTAALPLAPVTLAPAAEATATASSASTAPEGSLGAAPGLTEDELALVDELQARDREVRSHEAAHQAAGGSLAGGASFAYQKGPDGRSYAVGGEVPIDLSSGRTPEETIRRARTIRAAALAPADPSGQDLQVAASAAALELAAQLQLGQLQRAQAAAPEQKASSPRESSERQAAYERGSRATQVG